MTRTVGGPIEELRAAMAGVVFTPEDPDYDQARLLWNADADRRPAVVARCSSAADVVAAVRYAQAEGLEIAVRCGAHSASGQSGVRRRPGRRPQRDAAGHRRPRAEARPGRRRGADLGPRRRDPGARAGRADRAGRPHRHRRADPRRRHGLADPAGRPGHATTSSRSRSSSPTAGSCGPRHEENPDLFWAVRGGGGNFGVVTEFEYRLHEVGPMIQFGFLFWEAERGREALRAIREAVATLPRSCNVILAGLNAPPAPFVPEEHHLKAGFALVLCGFGDPDEHAQAVDRLRAALPPLFEAVTPMPYTALKPGIRPGQLLGSVLLRDVHAVRGADRRRHRRHGRAPRTPHVPGDRHPDLPARRGVQRGRAGRDRVRRDPRPAVHHLPDRHRARRRGAGRRPGVGTGYAGRTSRRSLSTRAPTSTPWPSRTSTGCVPRTEPSTTGWRGSRPSTTRATSSTATSTSSRPERSGARGANAAFGASVHQRRVRS